MDPAIGTPLLFGEYGSPVPALMIAGNETWNSTIFAGQTGCEQPDPDTVLLFAFDSNGGVGAYYTSVPLYAGDNAVPDDNTYMLMPS